MDSEWIQYLSGQLTGLEKVGNGLLIMWVFLGLILFSLIQTWTKPAVRRFTVPVLTSSLFFLLMWELYQGPVNGFELFSGMLVDDLLAYWGKMLLLLTLIVVLLFLSPKQIKPAFFPMMLGGVVGAIGAIMSQNLLLMILTLELLSLVSYVMVAMEKEDKDSARSALQYLLFGLFSSALSLYGLSWLYGLTGTFDLGDPAFLAGIDDAKAGIFLVVLLMLIGTFLFKLSAFPFHFWTPEVYHQATYPLIAYLSTIPKIAGAFVLLRLFHVLANSIHAPEIQFLCLILAGLSMTWGNLSALTQERFKSMAAFSGVAHAGYILMGLAWMSHFGEAAVMFYTGAYVVMNMGVILAAAAIDQSDQYVRWAGQSSGKLLPAIHLMVHLIALTGLPPSMGFTGKLYLFSSGMEIMEKNNQVIIIAILTLAIINTLISLFYYLKPAVWIFLRKQAEKGQKFQQNKPIILILSILSLTVIGMGIFGFDWLMDYLQANLWKN